MVRGIPVGPDMSSISLRISGGGAVRERRLPVFGLSGALFVLFMLTLPVPWIELVHLGKFSVKPVHVALLALSLNLLFSHRLRQGLIDVAAEAWPFALAYAFYLAFLLFSSAWGSYVYGTSGIGQGAKYVPYFIAFFIVAAYFSQYRMLRLDRAVLLGGTLSIALFLSLFALVFTFVGKNLFIEYLKAIARGDAKALQFEFYGILFNYASGEVVTKENAEFISVSLRNTLMGYFISLIVWIWAIRPASGTSQRGSQAVRVVLSTICALLVLLSVSRSNILVLVVAFMLAFTGRAFLENPKAEGGWGIRILIFGSVVVLGSLLVIMVGAAASGFGDLLLDRIMALSRDPRLSQYEASLGYIDRAPFFGYGIGAEVPGFGLQVHNIFLAAWFQSGIVGLAGSLAFYGLIWAAWLQAALCFIRDNQVSSRLARHWILALPILPLFRSLVGGEGGNFTLIEWACLASFFGLLVAYRREKCATRIAC
jgi:O-antigen ligase